VTDSKDRFEDPQLHRELRAQPMIKAPESLIPSVLSLIRQRQLAWYRRPATTWSRPLQFGLILACLMAFAGITWGTIEIMPALRAIDLRELFAVPVAKIAALSGTFDALMRAGALLGRTTIAPALLIIAAAGSLFYLVLFGAGTAIMRSAVRINN
jgi:hypothetical protein